MSTVRRADPQLWEKVKAEVTRGNKGGRPGQWSARKAQMAVQAYKRRGGAYLGGKSRTNHLGQWTAEDWGTKSGQCSRDTGERYLPKRAREALTDAEYRNTSQKKRRDTLRGHQYSKQPETVAQKTARHRYTGHVGTRDATKAELYGQARRHGIEGRSRMSKRDLAQALEEIGP